MSAGSEQPRVGNSGFGSVGGKAPENAFQMRNPAPKRSSPRVSSDKEVNRDGKQHRPPRADAWLSAGTCVRVRGCARVPAGMRAGSCVVHVHFSLLLTLASLQCKDQTFFFFFPSFLLNMPNRKRT